MELESKPMHAAIAILVAFCYICRNVNANLRNNAPKLLHELFQCMKLLEIDHYLFLLLEHTHSNMHTLKNEVSKLPCTLGCSIIVLWGVNVIPHQRYILHYIPLMGI